MQMKQRGNIEHLLVLREERGNNINACPNGIRKSHEQSDGTASMSAMMPFALVIQEAVAAGNTVGSPIPVPPAVPV